jgi:DHA1 family bicyclomycin/chloramphenicol resistance-like MFS transporter
MGLFVLPPRERAAWWTPFADLPFPPSMTPRLRISPHSFAFILFCGALAAFASLSIDVGLPAFGAVARDLGTGPARVAMSLSIFFVGFAIAPLVYGPLSDRWGRRPLLLFGCALYTLGGAGCTFSGSISSFLLWRLVQGAGAGAGSVLAMSLVRDHFEGTRVRQLLSHIAVIRVIAPMVAPSVGAFLLDIGDWRWIYAMMTVAGAAMLAVVWLGLEESAPRLRHPVGQRPPPAPVARAYLALLRKPACLAYMMICALGFGSHFAYVTGSSLVLMEVLGMSPRSFGLLFGLGACGIMLASYLSGRMAGYVSGDRLIQVGLGIALCSALVMLGLTLAHAITAWNLAPFFIVNAFCYGLITPSTQQGALQPLREMAGAAAAMMNALMMGIGAFASALVSRLFPASGVLAVTGSMAVFCALALAVFLAMRRFAGGPPAL